MRHGSACRDFFDLCLTPKYMLFHSVFLTEILIKGDTSVTFPTCFDIFEGKKMFYSIRPIPPRGIYISGVGLSFDSMFLCDL